MMQVSVYFNYHRKCFSVRSEEGENKGLVVGYADFIFVEDAVFKVSEAGRQRVLREKQKNIHAFVRGNSWLVTRTLNGYDSTVFEKNPNMLVVKYNPYENNSFMTELDGKIYPIKSAKAVKLYVVNKKPVILANSVVLDNFVPRIPPNPYILAA